MKSLIILIAFMAASSFVVADQIGTLVEKLSKPHTWSNGGHPKLDTPKDASATKGFREIVFIRPVNENGTFFAASSVALWPVRVEEIGPRQFKFLAHDYSEVKRVVQGENKEAQQDGADQPATLSKSK